MNIEEIGSRIGNIHQAKVDSLINDPKRHDLKCLPRFFTPILMGTKTFEIRKNDRDFKIGDQLYLREYDGEKDGFMLLKGESRYTGRWALARVTYITDYEQKPGFVVMGILFIREGRE